MFLVVLYQVLVKSVCFYRAVKFLKNRKVRFFHFFQFIYFVLSPVDCRSDAYARERQLSF